MIVGVVGDITVDEARALVTKAFGDWPKGPAVADTWPVPRTAPQPGVFEAVKADSTQSFVAVGHQGELLRTSPDYVPVHGDERGAGRRLHVAPVRQDPHRAGAGLFGRRRRRRELDAGGAVPDADEHARRRHGEGDRGAHRRGQAAGDDEAGDRRRAEARQGLDPQLVRVQQRRAVRGARPAARLRVLRPAARLARSLPRRGREGDARRRRARGQAVHPPRSARASSSSGRARAATSRCPRSARSRRSTSRFPSRRRAAARRPPPRPRRCRGRRPRPRQQGRGRHGRRGGHRRRQGRTARRRRSSATTPQGDIELQSTVLVGAAGSAAAGTGHADGRDDDDDRRRQRHRAGRPAGIDAAAGSAADADAEADPAVADFLLQRRAQAGFKAVAAGEARWARRRDPRARRRGGRLDDARHRPRDRADAQPAGARHGPDGAPADVLTEYDDYPRRRRLSPCRMRGARSSAARRRRS